MAVDRDVSVLIVDDYKTTVRIIQSLMRQIGFTNLDDAANGEDALVKLRMKKYGLVISDWNMAPVSGFELLQKVRGDELLKNTPFILITAESKTENVVAAKKAGVNNYIVKPFTALVLKDKITSVLGAF